MDQPSSRPQPSKKHSVVAYASAALGLVVSATQIGLVVLLAGCAEPSVLDPTAPASYVDRSSLPILDDDVLTPSGGGKLPGERDEQPISVPNDPAAEPVPAETAEPGPVETADPESDKEYVPDVRYVGPAPGIGHAQREIRASEGGRVDFGIFHLTVPVGATKTDVNFRIDVPASDAIRVILSPHGLQFAEPVTLTIDLDDAIGLGDDTVLYWWNQATENWENVGGVYDPVERTLTTSLDHFSIYAPGRAGWSQVPGKPIESEKD